MAGLLIATAAAPATAQESPALMDELSTSAAELEAMAEGLASESAGTRQEAIDALSTLEAEALPAIRQRIEVFEDQDLPTDPAYRALGSFRHVLGSRRADDMIDIAPGVPQVLAEERDELHLAMAERLLLARSLERMGTTEALRVMVDLMAVDFHVWRWEARRIVDRMGVRILPTLIGTRGHDDREARRWARRGIRDLEMTEAGDSVQQEDNALLADILRAYGEVRDMDAMPVVVSFTTHERMQVREAARWATRQYGRNAIWQLRRVYKNLTEEDASMSWGWERTMEALVTAADEARLEPIRDDLSAGMEALSRGELEAMEERFDAVLLHAPGLAARPRMAPGYAALATRRLERDDLAEARRLYRRAVRLAPSSPEAQGWRAQLAFIEAEESLGRGVVDLPSYRRALELDPDHGGARAAVDLLTGRAAEREERNRRWAAAASALVLAIAAAFLLLRRRRKRAASAADDEPADDGPDLDIDTAPDTLPG